MKVGDMVIASYGPGYGNRTRSDEEVDKYTGTIIAIDEVTDLFSEKYAITEVNTYVRVLAEGQVWTFGLDEDTIEVIENESR
tara:strand:- start:457 stop:702 length:246 start_codon:yes stop_codon:yes gene_type:complete